MSPGQCPDVNKHVHVLLRPSNDRECCVELYVNLRLLNVFVVKVTVIFAYTFMLLSTMNIGEQPASHGRTRTMETHVRQTKHVTFVIQILCIHIFKNDERLTTGSTSNLLCILST